MTEYEPSPHEGRSRLSYASYAASEKEKSPFHRFAIAEFDDPNLDSSVDLLEEDSPYPEVRSAVANTDDPDIPSSTLRSWVVGLIWAIIIPGLNQFFYMRFPSVTVTSLVAQLLSFPIGRIWARYIPRVKLFGLSLNPGPFTVKEHVLITVMANVGSTSAYAMDIVAVQRVYYDQVFGFGYAWLITMSTQLIGFSIGGIARRFLVLPPSMIWPTNLVTCALFNTLHSQQYAGIGSHGGLSRERFFFYAFLASAVWYFVPGYLFTALSGFSWVCWLVPNNVVINQLFGYNSGLVRDVASWDISLNARRALCLQGMSLITFDWSQIAYIGSPLATPWWAEANIAIGFVLFFWILTPILYYTNTWYAQYMPISSRISFDNTGAPYDVARIINADSKVNVEGYKVYSPLFLSTTFAMAYGLSFASITATLTHTLLYFRKQIWIQAKRSLNEQPDIHARLMARYPQVPEWWYGIVFVTMFGFGVISIEIWHTDFPVWALLVALMISFIYTVPIGIIQAITNQQIGLNVIAELVVGYMLPGRPVAMMLFKTWGYTTMAQALTFTSDFKLGHYMKIPPQPMFWAQITASVVALTVQLGVQSWMFANIEDICTPGQPDGFICPGTEVFATASIVWGVIGPARQFSRGQVYYGLTFFFLVGAILPIMAFIINRKWPNSMIKYVNFPIMFNGTTLIPPASAYNYVPWAIVGFIFNYLIRRRHFSWWTKYNYVLSAALDSGVAISAVLIFFCLQYPMNGTIGANSVKTWWGNKGYLNNADGKSTPLRILSDGETFGPPVGTWS